MSVRFEVLKPSRCLPVVCSLLLLAILAGCQELNLNPLNWKAPTLKPFNLRSQSPEDSDVADDDFDESTKVKTPLVGDYTTFSGLHRVVLEGVGLVVGLNGTGGDPPPSQYREALLDDLRRRNVTDPNELIASPDTALVVVRAYLPPLIRKGEQFDIEVRVPGDTGATSLNGGRLMATILTETAVIPGRGQMKGHVVAKAKGPILISTGEGKEEDLAGVLKRGWVLGGGTSLIERDMAVYLRSDFRNFRNVTRIADRIGQRFYAYNEHGLREPLAKAQTDQRILLKVHPHYRENYPRYMRVIQNIAFRETAVEQRVRMQRLERELLIPEEAEKASLQLEALGTDAIPILKTGLKSPHLECRFHASVAMAYLDLADGVDILKEAALKERAFRVFAFAALSTLDDPRAHIALRELMSAQTDEAGQTYDSTETRYGAFRALWTLNEDDPFIQGEFINKEFWLHPLRTAGEPMVHITHRKRAEIVLFGSGQEFLTPLALRAGNYILVTSRSGSDHITVSRFGMDGNDERLQVSKRIEDVIRAAAQLGASYPDIAQMLVQADRQDNLPGRFEIDALPQAGRTFYRDGESSEAARLGRSVLTPNLFQRSRSDEADETLDGNNEPLEADAAETSGTASLADARSEPAVEKKNTFRVWPWSTRNKQD